MFQWNWILLHNILDNRTLEDVPVELDVLHSILDNRTITDVPVELHTTAQYIR